MIRSMTGYGTALRETDDIRLQVEIRALNSKYLDLNIKLPRLLQDMEIPLRTDFGKRFERGKVAVVITAELTNPELVKRSVDKDLIRSYHNDIKDIIDELNLNDDALLPTLLNMPDVLRADDMPDSDPFRALCRDALTEAADQLDDFRQREGEALKTDLLGYVDTIARHTDEVDNMRDTRIADIRERLKERLADIMQDTQFDMQRFEQEMVYYADKLDITEELVRLRNHLDYFRETLDARSNGKKLGFITQEMGREINTMGSKANNADIQRRVVLMKEELDKIKEQILNIL